MPKKLTHAPTMACHPRYPRRPRWHITQCWPRQIQTSLQIIFMCKFICGLWANIALVIFLCNVGQARSRQYSQVIFPRKDDCVLWDNIAQVIFLSNVVSQRIQTTLARRYSYAMLGVSWTTLRRVFTYAMVVPRLVRQH